MSGQALKDLNSLPSTGSQKKVEISVKGTAIKCNTESTNENLEEIQKNQDPACVPSPLNEVGVIISAECANHEVEYIESENLPDLEEDATICLDSLLARLDSKEWILICEALNNVRKLSLYHKEKLVNSLGDVIPLIVKGLKNPRSAVCKTAIMTCSDIFKVYNDEIINLLDPLLVQLLLKASQDKRFVCEAADAALISMTGSVSPSLLLPKLQPYFKNKNPRIRAKASICFSRSVPRLGVDGIKAYGIDKLIQTAASQLSDQLPESREAARILAGELKSTFEKSCFPAPSKTCEDLEEEPSSSDSGGGGGGAWEAFCQNELPPLGAQAILRVTSSP